MRHSSTEIDKYVEMILNMQSYFHDKTKYDIRSNSEKIKELMKM